jgi:hypothetical protein
MLLVLGWGSCTKTMLKAQAPEIAAVDRVVARQQLFQDGCAGLKTSEDIRERCLEEVRDFSSGPLRNDRTPRWQTDQSAGTASLFSG